jgi:hypothetical protein
MPNTIELKLSGPSQFPVVFVNGQVEFYPIFKSGNLEIFAMSYRDSETHEVEEFLTKFSITKNQLEGMYRIALENKLNSETSVRMATRKGKINYWFVWIICSLILSYIIYYAIIAHGIKALPFALRLICHYAIIEDRLWKIMSFPPSSCFEYSSPI